METKKFTQFGTFTVIILSVLLIVFVTLLIDHGFSVKPEAYMSSSLVLIFIVCLLTFYKLTIIIDNTTISFKLGIGIFGKSYKIDEIESCNSVKNKFIYGLGIHLIPNGWLYNVSGFKAIELTFKNSNKVIRIGTNKPEEIVELMQRLIK
jgi:hypothetical protein